MSSSHQPVKVTVDLSPFGKGEVTCDATLHVGALNQPEQLSIVVTDVGVDNLNKLSQGAFDVETIFGAPTVHGVLENGTTFETDLTFVKGIEFGFDDIIAKCYIGPFHEGRGSSISRGGYWRYRLANLHLYRGDAISHQLPPVDTVPESKKSVYKSMASEWHRSFTNFGDAMQAFEERYEGFPVRGGFHANRITFTFGNRNWILDDDLREKKNLDKINTPIVSGTLSTEYLEGDTPETVQTHVDNIADLLTFGLARDVKWVAFGCYSEDGTSDRVVHRSPALLPFNHRGSRTIDNWEPFNIKSFLETAEPVLTADREWWGHSIALLTQARCAKYLEVKCSLLNTLLDRLTSKVNGDNYGNEIDPKLNERLNRKWFRWLLHRLLRTLSKNWEQHRTDSLCNNVITGWNAEPSFPEKVIRSCDVLKIPALSRTKIGFRHKLIHAGEMHKKLKTQEKKFEYLFDIEAVVVMLMVQMFGFSGQIYLQSNPPDPKPVADYLVEQEAGK